MAILRTRLRKVLFGVVGVPTLGVAALSVYVAFRVKTKPPEHVIKPLVDAQGGLVMADCVIPPPTRWSIVKRVLELLRIFVPLAVLYVWMVLVRQNGLHEWLVLLLKGVEDAGPAFVKAGQWACTRRDIFSNEFRSVFEKLYCEVQVHPYAETIRVIEEDFKRPYGEVFSRIEEGTVGSGSIGQVHVAYLVGSDEKVVIKVMHPKIIETIAQDFYIINASAHLAHKYFNKMEMYDMPAVALAWTNHLAAQLDFRIEFEHLEFFRENFKNVDFVEFPRPIMSTQRVLVETFAEGQPALPSFLQAQEEHVRDVLATKGLNCWCKMLLRDNFIHGDMHPGNILIDTKDPHHPKVTMIDVGLCQKLSRTEGDVTFHLMESFVHWNPDWCSDSIQAMGTTQNYCDIPKFRSDMVKLFEAWRPKRGTDQVVTNILEAIFFNIRDNHATMDPPYVSLLFAVLILESFVMSLNPEFNMVRHAAPWLVSEGHLSPTLIKNVVLSNVDNLKQKLGANRSRVRDYIFGPQNPSLGSNVRMATA